MPTIIVVRRVDGTSIEVEVVASSIVRVCPRRPVLTVVAHVTEVRPTDRAIIKVEAPAAHEVRRSQTTLQK